MKTDKEIINEKSIDIFGRKEGVYASESLIEEALENKSELYINLAYTDYGGSLIDKYLIAYLIEKQSQDIVYETTSWNGMNAIVFGDSVKEIKEWIDKGYILGYNYFEEYFYEKENEERSIAASSYIDENDIPESKHRAVYDFFDECSVYTFGVDYTNQNYKNF